MNEAIINIILLLHSYCVFGGTHYWYLTTDGTTMDLWVRPELRDITPNPGVQYPGSWFYVGPLGDNGGSVQTLTFMDSSLDWLDSGGYTYYANRLAIGVLGTETTQTFTMTTSCTDGCFEDAEVYDISASLTYTCADTYDANGCCIFYPWLFPETTYYYYYTDCSQENDGFGLWDAIQATTEMPSPQPTGTFFCHKLLEISAS